MSGLYFEVFSGITYDEMMPVIHRLGFDGFFSNERKGDVMARMSGDVDENALFLKQQMASAPKYGHVPDGGEVSAPSVTRDAIEAIKDPVERVRMRAQHLDLYQ